MTPLRIVVDDSATSEAAARQAARSTVGGFIGSGAYAFVLGAAFSALGLVEVLLHMRPWYFGWAYIGLGVIQMIGARLRNQMIRRTAIATDFVVSDAGLAIAVRGETQARTYPWTRVRVAFKDSDFITIIVGTTNLAAFQRAIAVPKPDDAALCDAIWAALYVHMIAPRNLRATPLDRLGVIRNTAFA